MSSLLAEWLSYTCGWPVTRSVVVWMIWVAQYLFITRLWTGEFTCVSSC